jgi:two-component system cell cycle response regulator DivK
MPKILIVEDNEEHRDLLARHLQCRGFAIVTAADGKKGVANAQSEKPDLVLMDLNLPELDGWEATRLVKAAEQTRDLPVIAMIADAMPGDRERAFEVGCVQYHIKPVDVAMLLVQIETLLKGRTIA